MYHASLPSKRTRPSTGFPQFESLSPYIPRRTAPTSAREEGLVRANSPKFDPRSSSAIEIAESSAGRVNQKEKEKRRDDRASFDSSPSIPRRSRKSLGRRERKRVRKFARAVCTRPISTTADFEGTDNKVMHAVLQDAPYYLPNRVTPSVRALIIN